MKSKQKIKKAIIIANGDVPRKLQIKYLQKVGYSKIICADGGANSTYKLNIMPDLIIGDLDSINDETKNYYSGKCEIIKIKRQNDTDVEKALKYLIKHKFDKAVILGGTGNRLDHSICNLGIVLKFFKKINISILHHKSFLEAHTGNVELQTIENEIISLYGFDSKTLISSKGLKYPLQNIALPFGEKESTSNVAMRKTVTLDIIGGIIFIIRDFNLMKKYDLI